MMADNFTVKLSELSSIDKSVIEANAASQGISPQQYLANRGGVNPVTKKYGDSYNPKFDLTDAEYIAAVSGKTGTAQGEAINKAQREKEQKALAASGTAYQAPNGTWYATIQDAREAGALSGVGISGILNNTITSTAGTPEQIAARKSAYDLLMEQFSQYGLGALVEPLKDLVQQNVSPSEFSLRLQQTDAYKKRFSANADRIAKGLAALSPAEYIALEDQYQNVMRNYGLPNTYYAKDSMGTQPGFNQLLANDVSATELEDRISTAKNRVVNANPEVKQALRSFYPDITDGDILAYTLDPTKALTDIKRKVTAAEIGGAALGAGLATSQLAAEGLAGYGVSKQQAQQGYSAIAEFLPTGEKLSQIYQESPYTQTQAEQEIFNLADSASAAKKRKRLSELERGSFSGSAGMSGGALSRDRALGSQTFGAGSY